ncbi:unnamed protein product, partial [Ectocarpus sp. 6 AP-2014]
GRHCFLLDRPVFSSALLTRPHTFLLFDLRRQSFLLDESVDCPGAPTSVSTLILGSRGSGLFLDKPVLSSTFPTPYHTFLLLDLRRQRFLLDEPVFSSTLCAPSPICFLLDS